MKFIIQYIVMFLFCSCTLGTQQPIGIKIDRANGRPEEKLHGTWVLTTDDEYTGQTFPDEILYFHKDGQLLVDGPDLLCGRYSVVEDQLQIIAPMRGNEIVYFRKFLIDQSGLHLENINKGFAHYQRRKGMMKLCIPDEKWKLQAIGLISFKAPQEWAIQGAAPNQNGLQELQLINPDASKMLLVVRLPFDRGYPQEEVIKVTRQIASKVLLDTPMAGFQIKPAGRTHYFGITGTTFLSELQNPPLTLKVVIKRSHNAAVIIFVLYSRDQLMELANVAKLIYVDGLPVSSE